MNNAKQVNLSAEKLKHVLALAQINQDKHDGADDELAVFTAICQSDRHSFTQAELTIFAFCAEECHRQQSGPLFVYCMIAAWNLALKLSFRQGNHFTQENVLTLAAILEPNKNQSGYRRTNVCFANGQSLAWQNIPRQMQNLLAAQMELSEDELSADAVYEEFEKIHPFLDGNGRLGKILFNWRNNTLLAPIFPKEPQFMRSTTN